MKLCNYCGRENDDKDVKCRECGTDEFAGSEAVVTSHPILVHYTDGPRMKKSYGSTIEDAVYVGFRFAEHVGSVRNQMWLGFIGMLILIPVVLSLLPFSISFVAISFATLLAVLLHLLNYKKQFRKQLHKILIKARGSAEPVPCEYELNEKELICRSTGVESKIAWSTVTECKVTDMGIEVIMKPAFLLFIPKRLFKNAGEIEEWAGFIEKRMKSKQSPASNDSPPTSLGNSRVNEGPPSVS